MSEAAPQTSSARTPERDAAPSSAVAEGGPRRLRSVDLLQGADEVLIEHEDACYRLRRTSLGRLILTK
ncbi:hemin uptake protein HemP [Leptothrix discophora]|uniref:Hemin uptake protein HemP n=1 Tax=Leptothrix discophora TaxID=89 RepID=A0ABT9G522_LEPDI|nr:hemin uptake protein HemP [Leptothrix discophora]MDP4301500.1 hemin uptake protein HemP [Leptothrix discophora]